MKWQEQLCSLLVSVGQVVSEENICLSKVYRRWQTSSDGNTCSSIWSRLAKMKALMRFIFRFGTPTYFFSRNEWKPLYQQKKYKNKLFNNKIKITKLCILHVSKVKLTQYPTRYKNKQHGQRLVLFLYHGNYKKNTIIGLLLHILIYYKINQSINIYIVIQ